VVLVRSQRLRLVSDVRGMLMHWLDLFCAWLAVSPFLFGFFWSTCPCCPKACTSVPTCTNCGKSGTIDVDLGAGGWTNGVCTACTGAAGVITMNVSGINTCVWTYTFATTCTYPGNPTCGTCTDTGTKAMQLTLGVVNVSGCKWNLALRHFGFGAAPCTCGEALAGWDAAQTCSGTVALAKYQDVHNGANPTCGGAMPDPVHLNL